MSIKTMREKAGMSQRDLGRAIGSTVGRVWAWEAWNNMPRPKSAKDPHIMSLDLAKRTADALGVTLDEFHDGLDA